MIPSRVTQQQMHTLCTHVACVVQVATACKYSNKNLPIPTPIDSDDKMCHALLIHCSFRYYEEAGFDFTQQDEGTT